MFSPHFYARVARRAKSNKIRHLIGDINDEIVSSWFDVMNVKRSSALATFDSTPATHLITSNHLFSDGLPSPTMFHPLSTPVVGVVWSNHRVLCAGVRAETSPAPNFAGKSSVSFTAGLTGNDTCRHQQRIATCSATCLLTDKPCQKLSSANGTGSSSVISTLPVKVADRGTESLRSIVLRLMARSLEISAAMRASKVLCANLGGILAFLATHLHFAVVSLERIPALEAHLEHR